MCCWESWLCAKSDDSFSNSHLWQPIKPSVFGTCVPPIGHTQWRMLRSQNQQRVFGDVFAFALWEVHCATCVTNLSASRPFNCLTASQLWFGCRYLSICLRRLAWQASFVYSTSQIDLIIWDQKGFSPLPSLQNILTYVFSKRNQGDLLKRVLDLDPVAWCLSVESPLRPHHLLP